MRLSYKSRICQRQRFCPKYNSDMTCDMVLRYQRKIKQLILGRYCRYLYSGGMRDVRHITGFKDCGYFHFFAQNRTPLQNIRDAQI